MYRPTRFFQNAQAAINAMTELFPTFSKWFKPHSNIRIGSWSLRGPTWFISTWLGDTLATQQRSLLRVLALAHSERLEFAPLVTCLAEEHRGRYRRLLKRFARRLESGATFVDALEQTPDVLDDDAVLALRFGSQSGTTQAVFDLLQSREVDSELNGAKQMWVYWTVLACTIALLIMFMMVLIVPTYKMLFADFGIALPNQLRALIIISDKFAQYFVLWTLVGVVAFGLFWSSYVRRFVRRKVAPMFVLPLAQLRRAELLKLLAVAVDSGRPLAGSISTLARYHYDSKVRQQLLFARNEIEQGIESWQGLSEAGFLNQPQFEAVATAPNNEIRAWTLRRLASNIRATAQRRTSLGLALMQPVVVLTFGAIVMFVFVSFFSVLVQMVTSLS